MKISLQSSGCCIFIIEIHIRDNLIQLERLILFVTQDSVVLKYRPTVSCIVCHLCVTLTFQKPSCTKIIHLVYGLRIHTKVSKCSVMKINS